MCFQKPTSFEPFFHSPFQATVVFLQLSYVTISRCAVIHVFEATLTTSKGDGDDCFGFVSFSMNMSTTGATF